MKKVIALLVIVAIAVGAFFAVPAIIGEKAAGDIADDAKQMAAATALDNLGGLNTVEDVLRDNVITLATDSGLTVNQVSTILDGLNISNWETCALPSDAKVVTSFDYKMGDIETTITIYKDPSYLTATILDIPVTFKVPAKSQEYVDYIKLLA